MASEFLDRAVDAVADIFDSGLAAQLRLVETASGLASGALTDPEAIIRGQVPWDPRSPLIQIYDTAWETIDQRNNLWRVSLSCVLTHAGAPDITSGKLFARRYMAAIKRLVLSDPTAGDQVVGLYLTDGASAAGEGDNSGIRTIYAQGIDVDVYDG